MSSVVIASIRPRHCEPPGRANARPMTGSAKQSVVLRKERMVCFVATLLAMTAKTPTPSPLFLQIFLHLRAQAVAQVGARHAEGDVGAQEARLRAAIVPLAFEFDAVKTLRFGKADHRVGELDLAAGAALLGLENLEDLRLQDVA